MECALEIIHGSLEKDGNLLKNVSAVFSVDISPTIFLNNVTDAVLQIRRELGGLSPPLSRSVSLQELLDRRHQLPYLYDVLEHGHGMVGQPVLQAIVAKLILQMICKFDISLVTSSPSEPSSTSSAVDQPSADHDEDTAEYYSAPSVAESLDTDQVTDLAGSLNADQATDTVESLNADHVTDTAELSSAPSAADPPSADPIEDTAEYTSTPSATDPLDADHIADTAEPFTAPSAVECSIADQVVDAAEPLRADQATDTAELSSAPSAADPLIADPMKDTVEYISMPSAADPLDAADHVTDTAEPSSANADQVTDAVQPLSADHVIDTAVPLRADHITDTAQPFSTSSAVDLPNADPVKDTAEPPKAPSAADILSASGIKQGSPMAKHASIIQLQFGYNSLTTILDARMCAKDVAKTKYATLVGLKTGTIELGKDRYELHDAVRYLTNGALSTRTDVRNNSIELGMPTTRGFDRARGASQNAKDSDRRRTGDDLTKKRTPSIKPPTPSTGTRGAPEKARQRTEAVPAQKPVEAVKTSKAVSTEKPAEGAKTYKRTEIVDGRRVTTAVSVNDVTVRQLSKYTPDAEVKQKRVVPPGFVPPHLRSPRVTAGEGAGKGGVKP